MDNDFFNKLKNFAEQFSGKFNILEDEVDLSIQLEYGKESKKIRESNEEFTLDSLPTLDTNILTEDEIHTILIQLASLEDPKAYSILEEFTKQAPENIKPWAKLALQESRMNMEALFGEENQVFISTGMGGKDGKLRYFVALTPNEIEEYSDFQKKIIKSEFDFALKNNNSELESIEFSGQYAMLTVLIPFTSPFNLILKNAVTECNQYGDFLSEHFLITNVKKLTPQELDDIAKDRKVIDIDKLEEFNNLSSDNNFDYEDDEFDEDPDDDWL